MVRRMTLASVASTIPYEEFFDMDNDLPGSHSQLTPEWSSLHGLCLVYTTSAGTTVIERSLDELKSKEVADNWVEVERAVRKDFLSFHENGTFKRVPRTASANVVTSRWLFKWKVIDGAKAVKARLVT